MPSTDSAVLDTCCLTPGSTRSTLLRAATAGLYQPHLTEKILEELVHTLIDKLHMSEEDAQSIIHRIRIHFPEAFVTAHIPLIPVMPVNEKDQHVLAPAVASRAQFIVTENLKHFPRKLLSPFDIEALSVDDFLTHLFDKETAVMVKIIQQQASALQPPQTPLFVLEKLARIAPHFANMVRCEMAEEI